MARCAFLFPPLPGRVAWRNFTLTSWSSQTKTIEVSLEGLQSGTDPSLPPLMNPTMLEASDDLTNLSHLNEPAGRPDFTTQCNVQGC